MTADAILHSLLELLSSVLFVWIFLLALDSIGTKYLLDKRVDAVGPQLFFQATQNPHAHDAYSLFTELLGLRGLAIASQNPSFEAYQRIVWVSLGIILAAALQLGIVVFADLFTESESVRVAFKWVLHIAFIELVLVLIAMLAAIIRFERYKVWADMINPKRLSQNENKTF